MPGKQQLLHLVKQPCGRHIVEQRREFGNRRFGRLIDRETELGGETRGAQHAYRVFTIARCRVTDHHDTFLLDVGKPVHVIPNFFALRIVKQRVHGEVATDRVFALIAVNVVAQEPAMLIGTAIFFISVSGRVIGAERGDLHRFIAKHDMHQFETPANDACAAKHAAHLLRGCVGGNVVVFGVTV